MNNIASLNGHARGGSLIGTAISNQARKDFEEQSSQGRNDLNAKSPQTAPQGAPDIHFHLDRLDSELTALTAALAAHGNRLEPVMNMEHLNGKVAGEECGPMPMACSGVAQRIQSIRTHIETLTRGLNSFTMALDI